jgi:N-acetylglucosamine kinase-like BadF-type ATPase
VNPKTDAERRDVTPPPQAKPVVLGIDGGSTKTRIQVRCAETNAWVSEHVYAGSTNLYMHPAASGSPQVAHDLEAGLSVCLKGEARTISACVIGTAGIDAPHDDRRHREAFLGAPSLSQLGDRLKVLSDVEIIAACGERAVRVCSIAGTGSNTLGLRYEGQALTSRHQVGGMDLLLSDEGSAAWIGHHAFRAALHDLQGVTPSALGPALLDWLGLPNEPGQESWRPLRTLRTDLPKARLAEVTEAVVLPLIDTDPVAEQLIVAAADRIAHQIVAAARGVHASVDEALEVLTVGGVWRTPGVHEQVTQKVHAAYPHATVNAVDPAQGACRIARKLLG